MYETRNVELHHSLTHIHTSLYTHNLPTIDPDYNPTSDNFSLSDAGGTVGSQSLFSTSVFGSQTRARFGSVGESSSPFGHNYLYNEQYYSNEDPSPRSEAHYNSVIQHNTKQTILDIYAPAGKLGVVIDVPIPSAGPIVHAIKDTCPIREKTLVGDYLLAVDDIDATKMNALEVSRLISKKSLQEARKLTVRRGVMRGG